MRKIEMVRAIEETVLLNSNLLRWTYLNAWYDIDLNIVMLADIGKCDEKQMFVIFLTVIYNMKLSVFIFQLDRRIQHTLSITIHAIVHIVVFKNLYYGLTLLGLDIRVMASNSSRVIKSDKITLIFISLISIFKAISVVKSLYMNVYSIIKQP